MRTQVGVLEQQVLRLQVELAAMRATQQQLTEALALSRAAADAAEQRAQRAEERMAQLHDDVRALRVDVSAMCEELVWAFAGRRVDVDAPAPEATAPAPAPVPATVIDLRDPVARPA